MNLFCISLSSIGEVINLIGESINSTVDKLKLISDRQKTIGGSIILFGGRPYPKKPVKC
jgi:hypothetical protein